jgi:uncharacterized Rmd1/YagE family protein
MDQALLGPFGALIAVTTGVVVLWRLNVEQLKARLADKDKTHSEQMADKDKQIERAENLRLEERQGRIDAEKRLDRALDVSEEATGLASKYEALVRERVK